MSRLPGKRFFLAQLLLLMQFSIVASSCAQNNNFDGKCDCATILAMEQQIDNLEEVSKKNGYPDNVSVWKASDVKPSMDKEFWDDCRLKKAQTERLDRYCNLVFNRKREAEAINFKTLKNIKESRLMEIPVSEPGRDGDLIEIDDKVISEVEPDSIPYSTKYKKGFTSDTIHFPGIIRGESCEYHIVVYDPKSREYAIDFLLEDPSTGDPVATFKRAAGVITKKGKLAMLMNAGIFSRNNNPLGLFITNKETITVLNTKKGDGNFYMQPNGVFFIDSDKNAGILPTSQYDTNTPNEVEYATQSGPMLVYDNHINKEFKQKSENKHIRNGVGVLPNGKIVFAISSEPVNFYDFANFFKTGFNCKNALYLDGTISKMYAPKLSVVQHDPPAQDFAGIIAIYKKNPPAATSVKPAKKNRK
jgi:uncharacterized protein YigE (DUF2233 family)